MINDRYKQIVVCSARNLVNKSKIIGKLDMCSLNYYLTMLELLDFVRNNGEVNRSEFNRIQDIVARIPYTTNDVTSDIKAILPDKPYTVDPEGNTDTGDTGGSGQPGTIVVTASNFTVTGASLVQETLFGVGDPLETYRLNEADFLAAYSDNNDGTFSAVTIDRTDLDGLSIKFSTSATTGNVFGENSSSITIQRQDLANWALYVRASTTDLVNTITYNFVDIVDGQSVSSNTATLTINRTASANQPATIGDNTIGVDNRAVTVLTLAMFTTQLTPPYNDPEGDLIDAIRLDEISTANQGTFLVSGIAVTEGQIITRETIDAGLFTHEAANVDAISSDVFSFSARDEGSQIWVS